MIVPTIMRTIGYQLRNSMYRPIGRCVALLGGSTHCADCLVALYYLTHPRQLIQGPVIAEYEQAFARQVGVRYAFSFVHGRVGLYGLLHALQVGPGDEVLVQVPTHIVIPNAIRYVGAKPVYVDCQLDTYNMDLELAEQRITPRTRVIILQHTFGIPADLDTALEMARRHNLVIIEDCVHALGAAYDGRQVGSFGRAAFFSTEETKIISTTMGGMVVTDDPILAERMQAFQASCAWPSVRQVVRYILKMVLYHLLTEPHLHYYIRRIYELLGKPNPLPQPTTSEEARGERPTNYEQRFSNAQAALGLNQLRHLAANLAHRRAVANIYKMYLAREGFALPRSPALAEPAFVRYPVWTEDRDLAISKCARYAVLGKWFTSVLEEAISPKCGDYNMGTCPRAEAVAEHLVNLPTHQRVSRQDVETIISMLVVTKAEAQIRSEQVGTEILTP